MAENAAVRSIPVPEQNSRFCGVQPDRYAVKNMQTGEYHFFQVLRGRSGKWKDWTFLEEITGGASRAVGWRTDEFQGILGVIAANPVECLKQYGQRTGVCGKCKKTLTDPVSVKVGVGPDCCEKYGIKRPGRPAKPKVKKKAAVKAAKKVAVKKAAPRKIVVKKVV